MPIEHVLWKVGDCPERVAGAELSEKQVEDMIATQPEILSSDWMLIGRQEKTPYGGIVDLLAVVPDGSLVLIEIKRGKTPREVVAQALDYASWVKRLELSEVTAIYRRFSNGGDLAADFKERFRTQLGEDEWNQSHQIVIVAAELDDSTERIAEYLSDAGIPINALCFRVFEHAGEKLLSRAWLVDPSESVGAGAGAAQSEDKMPWNGEYYVSYGGGRSWDDARSLGFISGGGGPFYSGTLQMLSPGDRIWVNIPGKGYVGVGLVTEKRRPITEFEVNTPGGRRPALDVISDPSGIREYANDPDKREYAVRVEWLDTKRDNEAFREVGLFGNQNTVCRPMAAKWPHTVGRLKSAFPNWTGQVPDPTGLTP